MRRVLAWSLSLVVTVTACGDDAGSAASTTLPETTTTLMTTTTVVEAEEIAAGAEALIDSDQILLVEDFQSGQAPDWQIDAGWFVLATGERRMFAASGPSWAWYTEGLDWSDYGTRLAVRIDSGSLALSVAVGPEGRYVVNLAEGGVHLLRDVPYGSLESVASAAGVELGSAHILAVGLLGGRLQVYVDGSLVIDFNDPEPLTGGSIGLGAMEGSVTVVDNIVVAGLSGALPDLIVPVADADAAAAPDEIDAGPSDGEAPDAQGHGVPTGPDVEMIGVSLPARIVPNTPFDVSMTVANAGPETVGPFMVEFQSEGAGRCSSVVQRLDSMLSTTVTCQAGGAWAGFGEYEWIAVADSDGQIDEEQEDDNIRAGVIVVGAAAGDSPLPDLTHAWVEIGDGPHVVGGTAVLAVAIAQRESWFGDVGDVTVQFSHDQQGTELCRATAPVDGEARCETIQLWEAGDWWVRYRIDPSNQIEESNEGNNTGMFLLQVSGPPNLAFQSVRWPTELKAGSDAYAATVNIVSTLSSGEADYTIRLFIDGALAGSTDTNAGGGAGVYVDLPPLAAGQHVWRVLIDADDDIAESNETDNEGSGIVVVAEG